MNTDGANAEAPDRNLALDLVRVTESAALAASRWMGRGDKEGADGAAVDAMRQMLRTIPMDGTVIIGEGEKDEAPMLFNGERVGDGTPPSADIAVDPIDGTTLTALGRGNALAVIAVSDQGTMFDPGPCVYMEKIAVGPGCADAIDITLSPTENLQRVAEAKGESVRDITADIPGGSPHAAQVARVRGVLVVVGFRHLRSRHPVTFPDDSGHVAGAVVGGGAEFESASDRHRHQHVVGLGNGYEYRFEFQRLDVLPVGGHHRHRPSGELHVEVAGR